MTLTEAEQICDNFEGLVGGRGKAWLTPEGVHVEFWQEIVGAVQTSHLYLNKVSDLETLNQLLRLKEQYDL